MDLATHKALKEIDLDDLLYILVERKNKHLGESGMRPLLFKDGVFVPDLKN